MAPLTKSALLALSALPSSLAGVLQPRLGSAKTLIPNTSFSSTSAFTQYWGYNYPWGTDHNGAARMNAAYATLSNNVLTMTAQPVTGQPAATFQNKPLAIHYLSGTVHALQNFAVAAGGGFDFYAEFVAPTQKGCWPAFWLTAVNGWPPEIDLAEWKGDGKISFNTFNTSSVVSAKDIAYPNPTQWHTVKVEVRAEADGKNVVSSFYLDGALEATQYAPSYVGQAMYLILDYQMEGSSGSPGPTTNTTWSIRNLSVISYNP